MKFICDSMVGKLARWLRMMGFDTVYEKSGDLSKIIKQAEEENRVILTRNSRFKKVKTPAKIFFLSSEKTLEQVKQVFDEFNLRGKCSFLTRCMECNSPLKEIKKEDVKGKVPFFVYDTHEEFAMCPVCGRIYWEGTHVSRMKDKLQEVGIWPLK